MYGAFSKPFQVSNTFSCMPLNRCVHFNLGAYVFVIAAVAVAFTTTVDLYLRWAYIIYLSTKDMFIATAKTFTMRTLVPDRCPCMWCIRFYFFVTFFLVVFLCVQCTHYSAVNTHTRTHAHIHYSIHALVSYVLVCSHNVHKNRWNWQCVVHVSFAHNTTQHSTHIHSLYPVLGSTSFMTMGCVIFGDFRFIRWFYCEIGLISIQYIHGIRYVAYAMRLYTKTSQNFYVFHVETFKWNNFSFCIFFSLLRTKMVKKEESNIVRVIMFFKWWFGFWIHSRRNVIFSFLLDDISPEKFSIAIANKPFSLQNTYVSAIYIFAHFVYSRITPMLVAIVICSICSLFSRAYDVFIYKSIHKIRHCTIVAFKPQIST